MIAAIRKLVLGERRDNENLLFPYWVIVQPKWGNDILLAGVWFSREDAEHHLQSRRNLYGRRAVVRCMSAAVSETGGLRQLYMHVTSEDVAFEPRYYPGDRPTRGYAEGEAGFGIEHARSTAHVFGDPLVERLTKAISMAHRRDLSDLLKEIRDTLKRSSMPHYPEIEPADVESGKLYMLGHSLYRVANVLHVRGEGEACKVYCYEDDDTIYAVSAVGLKIYGPIETTEEQPSEVPN